MNISNLKPHIIDRLIGGPSGKVQDTHYITGNVGNQHDMLLQFINAINIDDIVCNCGTQFGIDDVSSHDPTCPVWLYDKLSQLIGINISILTQADGHVSTTQALLNELNNIVSHIIK